MSDVSVGEMPIEPVPSIPPGPEAAVEHEAALPEAAAADALVPAPDPADNDAEAAAPSTDASAAPAADRAMPEIEYPVGPLRQAVLDALLDADEPLSVSRIIAEMPAGTSRGSAESAIKREFDAGRIERVSAGHYVLAKPKPAQAPKPAPPPDPVRSDGTTDEQFFALLDTWTASGRWEGPGNPPGQAGCLVPLGVVSRHNDRIRKREERRKEREAAAADRTAADRELRSKLLAACNGNFQPGPGLDDLSPIKSVLEIVPLDRVLTTIRYKVDKRSYPANPTLVSWRDPVLLKEIAENYCRTLIVPRLIAAWTAAGSPAPTAQSLQPSGEMPDIDELRGLHDSPSAPPGPHVMPRATLCRPGCAGERR